jgi:hypothetical protein
MTHQMSSAMFRAIAGLCGTMVVANTGGSFALLIIFMLGGFIMPRTQIKPWWIWGYWSSPLAYAQTSITVNEFLAPRWMKVSSTKTNAKKNHYNLFFAPISSNWKLTFKKKSFINPLSQKKKKRQFFNTIFFLNDKMGGVCFGGNLAS